MEQNIGKKIDAENLERYFSMNGDDEYIFYANNALYDDDLISKIQITEKIAEYWRYYGIDLRLYIWVDSNYSIQDIQVHKYKDNSSGHGRYDIDELTPNQQEYRILKRALNLCLAK